MSLRVMAALLARRDEWELSATFFNAATVGGLIDQVDDLG